MKWRGKESERAREREESHGATASIKVRRENVLLGSKKGKERERGQYSHW